MNATRLLEKLEASRPSVKVYPFVLLSTGDITLLTYFKTPNPTPEQIAERVKVWEEILEPIHKRTVNELKKDIRARRV